MKKGGVLPICLQQEPVVYASLPVALNRHRCQGTRPTSRLRLLVPATKRKTLFWACPAIATLVVRWMAAQASRAVPAAPRLQVGADAVVRSLALTGLRVVGQAPAPSPGAHVALTGTPLEPYVNPRHPDARPGNNGVSASAGCLSGLLLQRARRPPLGDLACYLLV